MKLHFRKNTRWMIDNCTFQSPLEPIEKPFIWGGRKKSEMPENNHVLIEGFDVSPQGTIDRLLDIIEKEAPHRIRKELVPRIRMDNQNQTFDEVCTRTIIDPPVMKTKVENCHALNAPKRNIWDKIFHRD